jgi:RNA polymerase sigma factor (sigma-70 family)
MAQAQLDTVLRHFQQLTGSEAVQEGTDAQLLQRFSPGQDEAAFAALLQRHSRLVWSVCWQVLGHQQDAEDAFQATFLALARDAAAIRQGQAIPSWLYQVGRRVAHKVERERAKRQAHERQAQVMSQQTQGAELAWRELQAILDEELGRLPEKFRVPFLLCCLEGHSKAEAARQLGWKEGTLSGRLALARKRLQQRLTRRGVSLVAALCCLEMSRARAVPPPLIKSTLQAAVSFAAGKMAAADLVSARVAALSKGASPGMLLSKVRLASVVLAASFVIGAGWLTRQALASKTSGGQYQAVPLQVPKPAAPRDTQGQTVVIKGRVLDPDGKPLAGARLYLSSPSARDGLATERATSEADGRFEFTCPRAALARTSEKGLPGQVMAVARGYGCDWAAVEPKGKEATLNLKLVKDLPINLRILDQDGEPIVGARVRLTSWVDYSKVVWVTAVPGHDLMKDWLTPWQKQMPLDPKVAAAMKSWGAPIPQQPQVATTGADGRVRLTGLGRDRVVGLHVEGPRMVADRLIVRTVPGKTLEIQLGRPGVPRPRGAVDVDFRIYGATFDYVARPSRPIKGVVRDKATSKPLAGVVVWEYLPYPFQQLVQTQTDREGKYELHGYPKSKRYTLNFRPPNGQHFAAWANVTDTAGFAPLTLDTELSAGIPLRGRVTDRSTGKPIPGARVRYHAMFPNPHARRVAGFDHSETIAEADGSFTLAVVPGPGVLGVTSPRRELYLPAMTITREDEKKAFGKDFNPGRMIGIYGGGAMLKVEKASGGVFLRQQEYDALILLPVDDKAKSVKRNVALIRRGYEP